MMEMKQTIDDLGASELYQTFTTLLKEVKTQFYVNPIIEQFSSFKWAYNICLSRAFRASHQTALRPIPEGMEYGHAIYPLIDLANHHTSPISDKMDLTKTNSEYLVMMKTPPSVTLRAERDYKPGNEIVWSYRCQRNINMLVNYGFFQDINYCDSYDLFFPKEPNETCHEEIQDHCRFRVGPNGLNTYLLHFFFFRHTGTTFPENSVKEFMDYHKQKIVEYSIMGYRHNLRFYFSKFKFSLRAQRRQQLPEDYWKSVYLRYSIAEKALVYSSLKHIDRLWIQYSVSKLNI